MVKRRYTLISTSFLYFRDKYNALIAVREPVTYLYITVAIELIAENRRIIIGQIPVNQDEIPFPAIRGSLDA